MEYKPTFTISDTQMEKITDYLGYPTEIEVDGEMVANTETRPVFLLTKVNSYLRNAYKAQLANELDITKQETLAAADTDTITVQ